MMEKIRLNEVEQVSEGCGLCPRRCGVKREQGEKGYCGMTNRATAARASLHQWEEPCLSGSKGSGTVFFSGCALRCVYCQNQAISRGQAGKPLSVERMAEIFLQQQGRGAHNLNLVTADHYQPQVIEALVLAKNHGLKLPVVWNCSGYQSVASLKKLAPYVDIWLADFKYWSPERAQRYSGARDYPDVARRAVAEMFRQQPRAIFGRDGLLRQGVLLRHLLLPGGLADSKQVLSWLFHQFGNRIWYSLMSQYTPVPGLENYPELQCRVRPGEYQRLVDFCLDLGMENAFIQEGEAASDSFIPQFDGEGL